MNKEQRKSGRIDCHLLYVLYAKGSEGFAASEIENCWNNNMLMMNEIKGTRKQFVGRFTCKFEFDGNLHIHFVSLNF